MDMKKGDAGKKKLVYDLVEEHEEKSDVELPQDIVKQKVWFHYVMMAKA